MEVLTWAVVAMAEDPLRKREQFAVSLRKQKTRDIIETKRRRMLEAKAEKQIMGLSDSQKSLDKGHPGYIGFYKFLGEGQERLSKLMS